MALVAAGGAGGAGGAGAAVANTVAAVAAAPPPKAPARTPSYFENAKGGDPSEMATRLVRGILIQLKDFMGIDGEIEDQDVATLEDLFSEFRDLSEDVTDKLDEVLEANLQFDAEETILADNLISQALAETMYHVKASERMAMFKKLTQHIKDLFEGAWHHIQDVIQTKKAALGPRKRTRRQRNRRNRRNSRR
jgi:hypothetical protein